MFVENKIIVRYLTIWAPKISVGHTTTITAKAIKFRVTVLPSPNNSFNHGQLVKSTGSDRRNMKIRFANV